MTDIEHMKWALTVIYDEHCPLFQGTPLGAAVKDHLTLREPPLSPAQQSKDPEEPWYGRQLNHSIWATVEQTHLDRLAQDVQMTQACSGLMAAAMWRASHSNVQR